MSYIDLMIEIVPSLSIEDAKRLMDVVGEAQEVAYNEGWDAACEANSNRLNNA